MVIIYFMVIIAIIIIHISSKKRSLSYENIQSRMSRAPPFHFETQILPRMLQNSRESGAINIDCVDPLGKVSS